MAPLNLYCQFPITQGLRQILDAFGVLHFEEFHISYWKFWAMVNTLDTSGLLLLILVVLPDKLPIDASIDGIFKAAYMVCLGIG